MSGNVLEWCLDAWYRSYDNAPDNGTAWTDEKNTHRVLRGGSWHYRSITCRVTTRHGNNANNRDFTLGFRVVRH